MPFLSKPNVTVIDFACGTGFYSHLLLEWGASAVTGIDISTVMLEGARARLSEAQYDSQATFIQGDGSKPQTYKPPGSDGFDLATGVWFINYASDMDQLTGMFKSISMNLKKDGVFVGVCYNPTDDLAARAATYDDMKPVLAKTGVLAEYTEELQNGLGYAVRVVAIAPPGSPFPVKEIDFNSYHLKMSAFEEAARAGGMHGRIEWRQPDSLGEEWRKKIGMEDDEEGWAKL